MSFFFGVRGVALSQLGLSSVLLVIQGLLDLAGLCVKQGTGTPPGGF